MSRRSLAAGPPLVNYATKKHGKRMPVLCEQPLVLVQASSSSDDVKIRFMHAADPGTSAWVMDEACVGFHGQCMSTFASMCVDRDKAPTYLPTSRYGVQVVLRLFRFAKPELDKVAANLS